MCYHRRMSGGAAAYPLDVPKVELWPIEDAARDVGLGRATIFRYLAEGALRRYRATVGRQKTLVDIHELRRLVKRPPGEPVEERRGDV